MFYVEALALECELAAQARMCLCRLMSNHRRLVVVVSHWGIRRSSPALLSCALLIAFPLMIRYFALLLRSRK